nr:zinc finger, CCHC-type [Tanacetum cinerariifolium]
MYKVFLVNMVGNTVKDMTTNFGKLDKLEGHDFRQWQKKMHFLLTTLKVIYVLTTPMPELLKDATVEAIRIRVKWENDDYICRGHISNGMSDSLFDVYTNDESTKELWDSLKSTYIAEDSSSKKFLDDAIAWWIDSGATTHVCKDCYLFKTYEPVKDGSVLYMGDDHFAHVHGIGRVMLEFSSRKYITLFNVLYVPKFRKNLISGPVLNKCGYKQVYESDKYILSKCGVGFGYYNNEAIDDEIGSIMENNTWVLSDLPPGCKPLGCKWIFKRKMKVDGTIYNFKARLVIQGFRQKKGIDYFDTYAPVVHITTIRLLLALAAIHNLVIHQMDVKTVFLKGDLEEEVYMKQPKGFVMPGNKHKVCKLVKSLYGFKQAPKQWHQKFDEVVWSSGFHLNQSDKCVYSKFDDSGKGVINCLYVDDMLIFGTDQNQVDKTKKFLSSRFSMKDIGEADVILVEKLKPNTGKPVDQLEYSRAIGCLMYAMTSTRPDITYVVDRLSRFTSNPSRQHWKTITRLFKYLRGTMNYGLSYVGYSSVLEAYSDASWINHVEDSSSTSGWVFLLGGGAISWASKKQTYITGSTMESKFVALAATGKKAECLRNLIHEISIQTKPTAPISIRCDSAPTMAKAYNQIYNGKSRHLGVRHSMEYPAKIYVRSKLHYFPLIKDRLNETRRSLFRITCFGPWLDISYVVNDDGMIHYVLQTGFKFGLISLREHRNGDIPFRNQLFPEKIGYDVKIIDVLDFVKDEEKFSKVSDEDAIQLCLLLSLEGEHIWRRLYDSIKSVCSKHKLEHLDGLRKNPNHVPSYTLSGSLFTFKIWIIESSCESHRWWTRVPEIIPRAVSCTRTDECLKWEYFAELFDKPKNEDLSHSTLEDEPKNKDDISPKEDAGDVYCCDVNGDVSQCFILANILVEKAIERGVPKKRKFVDVVRSPYTGLSITLSVLSMEELANQKNVLNLLDM